MLNGERFAINSSIYRHFQIEEIRSKLFQFQLIYYDRKHEQLFVNTSKREKFISAAVLFFVMSLSTFALWDLITNDRPSMFEIYSTVMLFAIEATILQVFICIAKIRKTLYNAICHLQVIDDCLTTYWNWNERNNFKYYLNLCSNSITFFYNMVGFPEIAFYFCYPSTRIMDVIIISCSFYFSAFFYSMNIKILIHDKMCIYIDCLLNFSRAAKDANVIK